MAAKNIPAAQYLRMSTEHQQYSLANQATAIQKYAESRNFIVTRTYADPAKSGVLLKHRNGLRSLLQDVVARTKEYQAILVFDISRWGRFMDTDESAYYEFVCKAAGFPVHYCAEIFENDGSLPSSILKALKRAMAAEYSRELGAKVLAGQTRLAQLGFKQGTNPLGLGRLLVSPNKQPKQLLGKGERKSLITDRVLLVPGPAEDVALIRDIFRMFVVEKRSMTAIARLLNDTGVPAASGGLWGQTVVADILQNDKYIGSNVYGKTSMRLGSVQTRLPKSKWIITPDSHDAILDRTTFALAQKRMASFTKRKTEADVLQDLRSLLAEKGTLNTKLIAKTPGMPSVPAIACRVGSLTRAYELIGYDWKAKRRRTTDEQVLEKLKNLLAERGSLSASIIDGSAGLVSAYMVRARFGCLDNAYKLVGFKRRRGRMFSDLTQGQTEANLLRDLRALWAEKGMLGMKLLKRAQTRPSAWTLQRHFGSVGRAYELIGYDWKAQVRRSTNDQILQELRRLLAQHGGLSKKIINSSSETLNSEQVHRRFGSLDRAYELVGFDRRMQTRDNGKRPARLVCEPWRRWGLPNYD
jgi:DNA invertase Pin-like site-specific DNA recombinase